MLGLISNLCGVACAQSASSAGGGCEALAQAAATGLSAQLKADDATIKQPQSVTQFTCLGNFFHGIGLDVLTSGLNPASIAQAAMGQVCSELSNAWASAEGTAQCGLTVTGLDTNFNLGLGSGSFCPALIFGGGGSTLLSAGTTTSGTSNWDVSGATQLPDGYTLSLIGNNTGITLGSQ